MQRDFNLIRELLLKKEKEEDYLSFDEYDEYFIFDHILLLKDAGFIEGKAIYDNSGQVRMATIDKITWDGFEFLETIRNKEVLNKALEKLKPIGSFTFSIVKAVCVDLIKKQFN